MAAAHGAWAWHIGDPPPPRDNLRAVRCELGRGEVPPVASARLVTSDGGSACHMTRQCADVRADHT
eukprot:1935154-Prymnesium_polylepis.1